MRTVLICHKHDSLNRFGLARWLGSFSDLAGIVSIEEPVSRKWRRFRREVKRVGLARFFDVLGFRVYNRAVHARADKLWEARLLDSCKAEYPPIPESVPLLEVTTPNNDATERFLRTCAPDLMIARCKSLLQERIYSTPRLGTFVMHPGICPEYRNAHGCFWALANNDPENVGMTLLRIDRGVDTGPVYGYFRVRPDPLRESSLRLQHRTVFENLGAIRDLLREIATQQAEPIDTHGRDSRAYGQPWLTHQLRILRRARMAERHLR